MQATAFEPIQPPKRSWPSPPEEKNKRHKITKQRKTAHALTLKKIFIEQIRSGLKTIEARPYCGAITKYQVGDTVRFYYYTNSKDDVTCKITKIEKFPTFKDLLNESNFLLCIPDSKNQQDALRAYHKIPKYIDKEQAFGVVAVHITTPSFTETVQNNLF